MGAIYRIWNTVNGKSYIGQSYRPYYRIREHLMPSRRGGSLEIHADLHKYPPDSWKWEILAESVDERTCKIFAPSLNLSDGLPFSEPNYELWHINLDGLERELIRQYDAISNGYNITPGGYGRDHRQTTDETDRASRIRKEIYNDIDDYQFQCQHGISREAYQRQQQQQRQREIEHEIEQQRQCDAIYLQRFGVTYDRYERIIAEHGSWEAYQEHKDNRTGCWVISIAFLIFLIIVRAC